MKPAPFEYVAAHSVEEALEALRDDDARVLAGGQSLHAAAQRAPRAGRAARRHQRRRPGRDPPHRRAAADRRDRPPGRARALARSSREHWPLLAQAVAPRRPPRDPHARHGRRLRRARRPARAAAAARCSPLGRRRYRVDEGARCCWRVVVPPLPPGARTAFAEHARTRGDFPAAARGGRASPPATPRVARARRRPRVARAPSTRCATGAARARGRRAGRRDGRPRPPPRARSPRSPAARSWRRAA